MDEALRIARLNNDPAPLRLWRKFILTLREITEDSDEQRKLLQAVFDIPILTSRKGMMVCEVQAFLETAYTGNVLDENFLVYLTHKRNELRDQSGFTQLQLL